MGLRIGMRGERVKALAGGDIIHRLRAEDEDEPLPARPMSEVGPALPQVESSRRKRRRGLADWTRWMSLATVSLAAAVVVGMTIAGKHRNEDRSDVGGYVFEPETKLDHDQQFFLENAGDLIEEARGMLERYANATTVDEVVPLIRGGERVKDRLERLWGPWGTETHFAAGEEVGNYILDDVKRPAIGLVGRKGDFSRFEVVFVREGGSMKLDWEASQGIGEIQIRELQAGSAAGGLVRAVVTLSTFHTADFPESEFHSYQLADAGGDHFIWGFARHGSPVAAAFEAEFNEGSVLLEKSTEVRATMRLAASTGGGKYHEITEMLHKGWVSP